MSKRKLRLGQAWPGWLKRSWGRGECVGSCKEHSCLSELELALGETSQCLVGPDQALDPLPVDKATVLPAGLC